MENSRAFEIVVERDIKSITRDERDFKNTRRTKRLRSEPDIYFSTWRFVG